mgnify:CR=1 FL=1
MKDKIFGVLQRVGRSFMLPIAILPVAGLLLGLGSSFTNATTIATYGLQGILGEGTLLHSLLIIMNKVGSAIFDNLPLIFAVGVAIGMAKKEKEVAALSALIAYFVMHMYINSMLEISGKIAADGPLRVRFWKTEKLQNPFWKEPSLLSAVFSHCRWVCLAVSL